MWRLVQVYWLISILDLRCTAFGDTSTIKIKTKNNGKVDPFSFDVFPTSKSFGSFSDNARNKQNDPERSSFFTDMDFFDNSDDDTFYQSPFGENNLTIIKDYFSKSMEESRNKYLEDVNNIDKMFIKTPVKSNIDELLREETTHDDASSKNLNSSERTAVLNENIERNVHYTTKRSVDVPESNSSNAQIPVTNSLNSKIPPNANNSLFSDVHKASGSSVVTKLVSLAEKEHKHVNAHANEKERNRVSLGSGVNEGLLDSQEPEPESSVLESMNVVTEISVQETVDGRTFERKPSSEELRLIENKILSSSIRNTKEPAVTNDSREPLYYDQSEQNDKTNNNVAENQEYDDTQEINLPNEVIDDLSSFLKVDPNFMDDGMDKTVVDEEEVRDMDAILNDKYEENSNEENGTRSEETNKNYNVNSKENERQDNEENNNIGLKEDTKGKSSTTNGDKQDPRNYRKIFHTEHKNLSNVSDVKIMFSETEGDFLDDDDDGDYSLNVTEKPTIPEEGSTENNTTPNADNFQDMSKGNAIAESSLTPTDLPEIITENENIEIHHKNLIYDETTTTLPVTESADQTENYEELNEYSTISLDIEEVDNTRVIENIPKLTEREEVPSGEESTTFKESILNTKERVSISTQNINDTMHSQEPVTDLYDEFEDTIPDITEITFTHVNSRTTEMDDIDRTMALIKQILSQSKSSEDAVDEKSPSKKDTSNSFEKDDNKEIKLSNDAMTEPVTIAIDTSTMPIDLATSTEEFTETIIDSQDTSVTTEYFTNDFTREDSETSTYISTTKESDTISPTEDTRENINYVDTTESSSLYFTNTVQTSVNTQSPSSGNNAVVIDSIVPDTTELNIKYTTAEINGLEATLAQGNVLANTASVNMLADTTTYSNIETVNTNTPNVSFKENERQPHELSSSEVESIYNSKIEEYESLEDNNDDSDENVKGWTIFGNKNKEYERKVNKDKGRVEKKYMVDKKTSRKDGAEIVKKPTNKSIMLSDAKENEDVGSLKNDGGQAKILNNRKELDFVPVLSGTILNNSAEFSVKISKQDETFYVPSSAHMQENPNIINITWRSNEYLNNSLALRILEKEHFYMIKEIMINLLTGNEFIKQKKPVAFSPDLDLDDSISGKSRVVMMKDGTYITFSNVEFLLKNYEPLEYSEASMRERRLWHIEIAFICLTILAVIGIVFYVVAVKTKRKVTLREKNELAQVTHC